MAAQPPWIALATQVVASWSEGETVELKAVGTEFLHALAEWLAAQSEDNTTTGLGDWLVDRDEVVDVYGTDEELMQTVLAAAALTSNRIQEADPRPSARKRAEARWAAHANTEAMRHGAAIKTLRQKFGRRPAIPITVHGHGAMGASQFGGLATLHASETWPVCAHCGRHYHLLAQLQLATIPDDVLSRSDKSGWVQVFYCIDHDCERAVGGRGENSSLLRWLAPDAELRLAEPPAGGIPRGLTYGFQPSMVTGWTIAETELPAYLDGGQDMADALESLHIEWFELSEQGATPCTGDKVGGWPLWFQDPSEPVCPDCGTTMGFLLQLTSEGLSGHRFGGDGNAYIFQCDTHPERLQLTWQR